MAFGHLEWFSKNFYCFYYEAEMNIDRYFEISRRGSTITREIAGGVTTFMAMSYIIFVQVGILSLTGMPAGGIIVATCLSAAIASVVMGLWANYPIALAPGMGENVFFTFTLCGVGAAAGAFRLQWPEALGLVSISGVLFLLLSFVGFRTYVLNAIPQSLKAGIAAGIGLLISAVGLWYGNIVKFNAIGGPGLESMTNNPCAWLAMCGILLVMILYAFRIHGAVMITLLCCGAGACLMGLIPWPTKIFALPQGFDKTAGAFIGGFAGITRMLRGSFAMEVVMFTLVLLIMDMFDTIGTLVGVAGQCGLMKNGKLEKASQALAADAVGTIIGASLGTSTVTSFVESAAGVSAGARTGLAAIVAGACMAAAIFLSPIIQVIGGGIEVTPGAFKYPIIAPALVMVGAIMLKTIRDINWDDVTEYVPAFITVVIMPLTLSIATGIAAGFIAYAAGKLLTGKSRQCPAVVYIVAAIFLARYVAGAFLNC